jgi:SAM-dependent methyltransferase
MSLYQRLLGNPFVYNYVRPLAVGGIDMTPYYRRVAADREATILDVGCGTGIALRYLGDFERYLGIDTDPTAIDFAKGTYGTSDRVAFECRRAVPDDFSQIAPSHVLLAGLLHHLTDEEAVELLKMTRRSPKLRRVVTHDIVFLPREHLSNLLAWLDRGRFCRKPEGYQALAEASGLKLVESTVFRCHPSRGLALYFMMALEP